MVTVKRDAFARHDIVRKTVPKAERKSCHWCGSRPGRFKYGISPDRGATHIERFAFCCKSCRDAYAI